MLGHNVIYNFKRWNCIDTHMRERERERKTTTTTTTKVKTTRKTKLRTTKKHPCLLYWLSIFIFKNLFLITFMAPGYRVSHFVVH